MSNLSELESTITAYFLAEHAGDFVMADRFYPHGELVLIWEDKVKIACRKFGFKVKSKARPAALALLDTMIEKGAYSTKNNDFGGTMHNFQPDVFRTVLKDLKETDPIIAKAAAGGEDFWQTRFADLT